MCKPAPTRSTKYHKHRANLAKTVSSLPASDLAHRAVLRDAAQTLYSALQAGDEGSGDETSGLTAKEEVQLLHIME